VRRLGAIALLFAVGCGGTSSPTNPASREAEATTSTEAAPTDTTPGRWGIPEVTGELLAPATRQWVALVVQSGRIYAKFVDANAEFAAIARFDPDTGEVVAERTMAPFENYFTTDAGVVVLEKDRSRFSVYDLDTLEPVRTITLGVNERANMPADQSEDPGPLWIGLRGFHDDQLAGRVTRYGAVRLDIASGQVGEILDLPLCGGASVVQVEDQLIAAIACTNQLATRGLRADSTTEVRPALPVLPVFMRRGEDVWMRWDQFGVIGRWRDGKITTLDLNVEGPPIVDLDRFRDGPGGIWIAAKSTDQTAPWLVHRIDPEKMVVTARVWMHSSPHFIGEVGYTKIDGQLVRFDPATVRGHAPSKVVRPELRTPDAFVARTDEERAVVEVATKVLSPDGNPEDLAVHLEDAEALAPIRQRLMEVAGVFPELELRVTAVGVQEDTASVAYIYLSRGQVAFVPFSASLVRTNGRWMVTRDSVCALARKAAQLAC
jgi:hypothetical protein